MFYTSGWSAYVQGRPLDKRGDCLYVINLAGDVDRGDDLVYVERNHPSSSKLSFIKCTR
jgi:hypothetical protein